MSSHHKHHGHSKAYEYKIVSSHDIKKKDASAAETFLNELGSKGWDLVTLELNQTDAKGISFIGLMKRKTYTQLKDKKER